MAKKKGKKVAGNTLKWLLALFMFSGCMVYWFSFASIIFALLGIYFLPIAPIQNFFKNFMPKKKILRGIIAFVIFFFGCLIAPATETTTPETPSTDIVISSEATSEPTVEATTEVTTEPTTAPTAEPTTAPTTEPPTEPTTTPTIAPTITPENSTFEIHFIDVGQADAALVLCDGKAMLIDGGNFSRWILNFDDFL